MTYFQLSFSPLWDGMLLKCVLLFMTFEEFIHVQIFQFTSGRCYPLQDTEQTILIPGCAVKVSPIF